MRQLSMLRLCNNNIDNDNNNNNNADPMGSIAGFQLQGLLQALRYPTFYRFKITRKQACRC